MHILLAGAKLLLGIAVTRRCLKHLTHKIAAKVIAVESDAKEVIEVVEECEADPEEVAKDHTESAVKVLGNLPKTATGQRRFVAAMVTVARAEFGAPLPEQQTGVLRQATYLKIRTFLIKWCKDRHVRAKDIAANVDDATTLWFVPTRRDIRRALIAGSGEVAARYAAERAAHAPVGAMLRGLLMLFGHDVGKPVHRVHEMALPVPKLAQ